MIRLSERLNYHVVVLLGLLALLCLTSARPVMAQENSAGITLTAAAGYDGFYKANGWLPVQVTATNNGPPVEGHLEIAVGTGSNQILYRSPISLPTQSNKRTTLYVYLSGLESQLRVALIDTDDRLVAEVQSNRLRQVSGDGLLYGVVTPDPGEFDLLEDVVAGRSEAAVAYLRLDQLPTVPVAWNALDVLILNDVDTGQLAPDQLAALEGWVDLGGQLVITGGPGWQKTAAAFDALLPVTVTGSESLADLPALSAAANLPFRDSGPYLVTTSQLRSGELLFYQDNLPLLAARNEGRGAVYFLALDPRLAPLADWDGHSLLWTAVAEQVPRLPYWAEGIQNGYPAGSAVSSLPSLALPSAGQLFLFLTLYVAVVGPANYLVLKRYGRRELAWVTIPVIVLLFSVVSYIIGFQIKGNDVIINQMSVAYGRTDAEQMRVHTVLGLYSPRRAGYDLMLPGDTVIRPFDRNFGTISGGGNIEAIELARSVTIRNVRVDVSGMEMFLAESAQPVPAVTGGARLQEENGRFSLAFDIQNNSKLLLESAHLLVGNELISLGDLVPGQQISRVAPLTDGPAAAIPSPGGGPVVLGPGGGPGRLDIEQLLGTPDYYSDPELYPRFQLLEALSHDYGSGQSGVRITEAITLIAWADTIPLTVDVAERSADMLGTTLYFLELPLSEVVGSTSRLTVPASLMSSEVLGEGGGIYHGSSRGYSLPPGSWIEIEFEPWSQFQMLEVTELSVALDLSPTGNAGGLDTWLYDWGEAEWVEQPTLSQDGGATVSRFDRFIGPNNALRIRLYNSGSSYIELNQLSPTLVGSME